MGAAATANWHCAVSRSPPRRSCLRSASCSSWATWSASACSRCDLREILRLELDRRAVRSAVGRMIPSVVVAPQGRRVGDALLGDDAFERVEPVMVISLAGVGIARLLSALDL